MDLREKKAGEQKNRSVLESVVLCSEEILFQSPLFLSTGSPVEFFFVLLSFSLNFFPPTAELNRWVELSFLL